MNSNSSANMRRDQQRSEVRKPALFPRGLHFFLKDYEAVANAKFGDAAYFTFTGQQADYAEQNFRVYARGKLRLATLAQVDRHDEVELNMLKKRWFKKRGDYEDKLQEMFHEMILHISEPSMNLIQSFQEDYDACVRDKDPRALLRLIKKSHTQAGRVATREEKEAKKDRLKLHRQWDKTGKVHDIHEHNDRFRMLLDDTKELGIEWEEADIVDIYLKSVDNSLIAPDLARIKVVGSTEMPQTLERCDVLGD